MNIIVPTFLILFATMSAMAQDTSIIGEWKLSGYHFVQKRAFPIDQMEVTLNVDPSMRISGRSACNSYGGEMVIGAANRLSVGQMTSTDMACEGPPAAFEPLFMRVLENAGKYSLNAGQLTITDPETKMFLRFRRVQTEDKPKFLFIDNKTVPCPNAPARKCHRFREDRTQDWQILQSALTGFKFRPGRFYRIEVREIPMDVTNPGESPVTYKFIRVVRSARSEKNLYN